MTVLSKVQSTHRHKRKVPEQNLAYGFCNGTFFDELGKNITYEWFLSKTKLKLLQYCWLLNVQQPSRVLLPWSQTTIFFLGKLSVDCLPGRFACIGKVTDRYNQKFEASWLLLRSKPSFFLKTYENNSVIKVSDGLLKSCKKIQN